MARSVRIGKYKIANGAGAEHWAICVGNTWYEVSGAKLHHVGKPNEINKHDDDSFYTHSVTYCGTTHRTDREIEQFNNEWLQKHKHYNITKGNCQLYVREMKAFLLGEDPSLVTQNNSVGNGFMLAGTLVAAAGIVMAWAGYNVKNHYCIFYT